MPPPIRFSDTHDILRPAPGESCYRFRLKHRLSGKESEGWLTTELHPAASSDRNLLLCDDDSLLKVGEDTQRYAALATVLANAEEGRYATTKSVVNDLVDGTLKLAGVRVAVHKFGPVPAFVLDPRVSLPVHRTTVSAQIAVFPRASRNPDLERRRSYPPFFVGSRNAVRRCLFVAPHLLFQRYLEDVAEDFHDLRRTVTQIDLFRRAKHAESTLSQSVGSKLKVLVPPVSLESSGALAEREWWGLFAANAGALYEAAIGRALAYFLLNELYRSIGVLARSGEYEVDLAGCHAQFIRLLGPERADELFSASRVLPYLQELKSLYSASLPRPRYEAARDLLALANDSADSWCGEFAKFAAFAVIVGELSRSARPIRVFISSHQDVPVSEIVRDQITDLVRREHGRRASPLFVDELPAGSPHRHIIRAAIWLSHGAVAICPTVTNALGAARKKDYRWIARESEYALLLKKSILFGTEMGVDQEAVLADLRNPGIGYLVVGSKLPPNDDRAQRVAGYFEEHVHADFQVTKDQRSAEYMHKDLRDDLGDFVEELKYDSTALLLDGYVRQFPPEVQRALICTLFHLGPLGRQQSPWIVERLTTYWKQGNEKNAVRAFRNMWRAVRDRRLGIGVRGASLLDVRKGGYYEERVTSVVCYVGPEMDSVRRKAWRAAWLGKWGTALRLPLVTGGVPGH